VQRNLTVRHILFQLTFFASPAINAGLRNILLLKCGLKPDTKLDAGNGRSASLGNLVYSL